MKARLGGLNGPARSSPATSLNERAGVSFHRCAKRRIFLAALQPGTENLLHMDQVLCLALGPGQVVVMDNLSAHKIEKVPSGLKRREPHCSICRSTSPTSIRSKKLLKRIFTEGIRKIFKFYKEFGDIWKPMRCRRS